MEGTQRGSCDVIQSILSLRKGSFFPYFTVHGLRIAMLAKGSRKPGFETLRASSLLPCKLPMHQSASSPCRLVWLLHSPLRSPTHNTQWFTEWFEDYNSLSLPLPPPHTPLNPFSKYSVISPVRKKKKKPNMLTSLGYSGKAFFK